MGLYNPYWTKKTQDLCKPNPRELHKVFFLKP